MSIACKEARETKYWIRLLQAADYFADAQSKRLLNDNEELLKLISSILITTKIVLNS
jgi:four helix bundle protein